ncbi:hypothetical protein NC652_033480 [Populus alba x Populus x berolinensis]|nr:hypothetical protein NC652_033480 [Populus alba x Populus x berolinensis]
MDLILFSSSGVRPGGCMHDVGEWKLQELFDGIMNKDLKTWATMMEAYDKADLPSEA